MLRSRLVLLALLLAVVLAACGSSGGAASDNPVVSSPAPSTSTDAGSGSVAPSSASASGKCSYPSDGSTPAKDVGTPSTTDLLAPKTLTLSLSVGSEMKDVAIALKAPTAPCTVNAIS
ncbi:MAG TPA: hypothetical protein VGL26_02515, partial [Jatrophihabitans sp.]